jgi:enamine deaminase RidA (YjgF/YER057c/UK114 family)
MGEMHKVSRWSGIFRGVVISVLAASALICSAQVKRIPLANKSTFPISQGVWAGDTLYLSGVLGVGDGAAGDTEAQTTKALKTIESELKTQGLTLGNVVIMHAYLVGDPAKSGKMDFAGFMTGYTQFFGTKEQPNLPARSAFQVAGLAAPTALIEIEVIATRLK